MSLISFNLEKCTACGICSMVCPINVIIPDKEGFPCFPAEHEAFCTHCGHCETICPTNSITANYQAFPPEGDTSDIGQIRPDILAKYVQSRRTIRAFKDKTIRERENRSHL